MQVNSGEARWAAATAELHRQRETSKKAALEAEHIQTASIQFQQDLAASNAMISQLQSSVKVCLSMASAFLGFCSRQ